MQSEAKQLLDFFSFCEGLKKLERFRGQVFWRDYPIEQYESVADHTWRMMLMLIAVAPKLRQPIDVVKTMKMVVIHDLPEIIAGDLSPLGTDGTGKDSHAYDQAKAHQKFADEEKAAREIFGKIDGPLGTELLQLWLEYEAGESFEAKVATALDKLEGKLQAMEYTKNIAMPVEHLNFSTTYRTDNCEVDPILAALHEEVVKNLQRNYKKNKSV